MTRPGEDLLEHYQQTGLLAKIMAGLKALGKDLNSLTQEDLAPADNFHSNGLAATKSLAQFARLPAGSRVLDVGSGLGGPARYLAVTQQCDVTGIDLTPEFCEVANELSRLTGLTARTRFQVGNALELPFPDASFDVLWTMQMQMNIEDKRRLYAGFARVLKPGGRFVCQDICAGNGEPIDLPVPWASRPGQSHLVGSPAMRGLIGDAGLREISWRDVTAELVAARRAQQATAPASGAGGAPVLPPLGMHLVMGEHAALKMATSARNTDTGRIVFIQGVFDKPA